MPQSENLPVDWVLPAAIPFEDLKGKDLEECVYWLLDAMGAKDLEWRVGGSGGGAADQGRDLEATFYASTPDGELDPQRWWIECKGTVEPNAVKTAVVNAQAAAGIDVLVIATNTTFSNATRDWVTQWQATHPKPKVKLWDRTHLERFLTKHPAVVARLFSNALSAQGKLKALETRFWNLFEYSQPATLRELWAQRDGLQIDPLARIALLSNEFAHGKVAARPWAAIADDEALAEALALAATNLPYLLMRTRSYGIDERPVVRAIACLLLANLDRADPVRIAEMLLEIVKLDADRPASRNVQELLLLPIVDQLSAELEDVCGSDCIRISSERRTLLGREAGELSEYWGRLDPNGRSDSEATDRVLRIERTDARCNIGLKIDEAIGCPLFNIEPTLDNLKEVFATWKSVIVERKSQARRK